MALGATHIRFALALKEKYGVQEIGAFVSGSLYPDSRYVTGLDRSVTHPKDLDDAFFQRSDFNKGWLAHLLCDKLQREVMKEWIPEAFEGEMYQGSRVWVNHSALKVLQDIDDGKKFPLSDYLPYLHHVETPNGEEKTDLQNYNKVYQEVYSTQKPEGISRGIELFRLLGVMAALTEAIRTQSEEYAANARIIDRIPKIYSEMLTRLESV